ncbi:MAG: LuxR family transcriptional regulator, partial [Nevskiaceae bacterium]
MVCSRLGMAELCLHPRASGGLPSPARFATVRLAPIPPRQRMSPHDQLIHRLYLTAADADWQLARQRLLALLVESLGASGAAWLTAGESGLGGCYTESLHSGFSRGGLQALRFAEGENLLTPTGGPPARVLRHAHQGRPLVSLLALHWQEGASPPPAERLQQVASHAAEAVALSMRLFVRRDEWLREMGRQNRGAAALVDALGVIHAASERFLALLGADTATRFPLPEALLDEGGAYQRDGLHVRVEAMDSLYLVHIRQPLALDILSPREQQIARALGEGKTFKSIARNCGIAVSTVANHATRIYRKLGVYRREELVGLIRSSGVER